MPYPGRPRHQPLPQFRGTATTRPTPQQRAALREYVIPEYLAGRSLRELAELTDRTQTAIRRVLAEAGVQLRPSGAPTTRITPRS